MGTVYLICFDEPLAHAHHYIGYTDGDVERRLEQHKRGNGARLMAVLKERGIGWKLVRTWEGDRTFERKLKNSHNAPRLCPTCREAYLARHRTNSAASRLRLKDSGTKEPAPEPDDFDDIPF